MPKYINEKQVKDALNINDFKNITNDGIVKFFTMIPDIDKDVALAAIKQFPSFFKVANTMITQLNDLCDEALKNNKDSQNEAMLAYKRVLITCENKLRDIDMPYEQQVKIIEQMVDVADKMALKDTENKEFIKEMTESSASSSIKVWGSLLFVGFCLLGFGKFRKK